MFLHGAIFVTPRLSCEVKTVLKGTIARHVVLYGDVNGGNGLLITPAAPRVAASL